MLFRSTIGGVTHYLQDQAKTGSTDRTIYLWARTTAGAQKGRAIGTIYAAQGKVVIDGLTPDTTTPIAITLLPNSNDLAPKRNQLLDILLSNVAITGEVDTIAVAGSSGAINYTTQSRHRGT